LAEADFIWTPKALDAWLAQPWAFLPGNRMSYPGLSRQSDRDAAIAEILHLTIDSGDVDSQQRGRIDGTNRLSQGRR
jgi:hypothetical protein